MESVHCPSCGGQRLVSGDMKTGHSLSFAFKPANVSRSFFSLPISNVAVKASICRDCGVVTLVGDLPTLQQWVKDDEK